MMFGFWILIALFIAGLWWFGKASNAKRQCECEAPPEGRRDTLKSNRYPGGSSS